MPHSRSSSVRPSLLSAALAAALALGAAACGSASEAAPAPATAAAAAPTPEATCVEVMTRSRTCTDAYIPALVDARARHDNPPGITEAVKADRAAVIAQAMGEWQQDSQEPAIAARCARMAQMGAPAEDLATARACLAETACDAFVACTMPLFEKHLAAAPH